MMNVTEQTVTDVLLKHGAVFHQSGCGTEDTGQWCPQVVGDGTQQMLRMFSFSFSNKIF